MRGNFLQLDASPPTPRIVKGVPRAEDWKIHHSMALMGNGTGILYKHITRHLV